MKMETNNVTRVEVIDHNGRSYVNWNKDNKVLLSLQDEGRTLKIFVDRKETEEENNERTEV